MRLKQTILFIVTLLLVSPSLSGREQAGDPPNVIFIICDDLNDYEGVFGGHPQAITPNLDKLAASGVQFLNAASNAPVCQPSRNSIFTGVYPHDSKDFGWTARTAQPVLKHNKPIMQLLRENGYITAGSGKLLHKHEAGMWDAWGMNTKYNYGPTYYDGNAIGAHPAVPAPYREIGGIDGSYGSFATAGGSPGIQGQAGFVYGNDLKPFRYVTDNDRDLMQDELHAQWAVQQLQQFENNGLTQPFFLGIGFVRPHTPLHAPQKYFDMYPIEELELADWIEGDERDTYYKDNFNPDNKGPRYYRTILESYGGDRELALKKFLQAYLACVTFVDDQIGVVLDGLENSIYKDNTIVILTSDHGWQMGEKQYLFKNSAWEETVRVPLVIRAPGISPGATVEQPVSLVDLYPTIVDYCQLEGDNRTSEAGASLGGNSLRPLIEQPGGESWTGPEGSLSIIGNVGVGTTLLNQTFSYRTKDYRYILYPDGSEELYDHRNDSFEWYNLAYKTGFLEVKKSLRQQLLEMIPLDSIGTAPLISEDFESYSPGYDLESVSDYKLWGQNSTIHVSDDPSGLGPFEGSQYALTNAYWGAFVVPLTLLTGRTYTWSLATKVEIDNPEDDWKRRRSIKVNAGEYEYLFTEIDSTIDDWVETRSTFTIDEGYESVNLQVTGNYNFPLGIDNFYLWEAPLPFMKMYYDGRITEGEEDGEIITLILHNDAFADPLADAALTVEGLPDGVAAGNLSRIDSVMAQFVLSGNTSAPYLGSDRIGLTVTLDADQFLASEIPLNVTYDVVFSAMDTSSVMVGTDRSTPVFMVYPNPATSYLNIIQPEGVQGRLELFSMAGKLLLSEAIESEQARLELPSGLNGLYLLRLCNPEKISTQKVMIYS